MLVNSIFSFSHNVFYSIKDRNYHSCYIYFGICKCFQFEQGQIFVIWEWVNPLQINKIFNWSKSKAFVDDKINVTEKLKFVLVKVENIVGKGEIAGYQHFLLYTQCFKNFFFQVR